MIKNEYNRYMQAKFNFVILFCLILIAGISFFGTHIDINDLNAQIQSAAPDFNISKAQAMLMGTNGITYFVNFIFSSNFYVLTIILLLLGFGVVLGDKTYKNLCNGYGNNIIVRSGYAKYIKNILIAQCCYIITVVGLFFIALVTISLLIWPANLNVPVNTNISDNKSVFVMLIYSFLHIAILVVYICLLFFITSLATIYLKNRFIIQALPVSLHFIPLLLASTLGNIGPEFAMIFTIINPEMHLFTIKAFLTTDREIGILAVIWLSVPGILVVIALVLYRANIIRYKREYLL